MMIAYDRVAFIGKEDSSLRITFDKNIRWRKSDLSLKSGGYEKNLLREGDRLMEIKIAGAMPMNLARILSEMKIFKTSFSKYGNAYVENLLNEKARNIIVMNERQQSLVLGRKEEVAYA